jgi:hypothetical protein
METNYASWTPRTLHFWEFPYCSVRSVPLFNYTVVRSVQRQPCSAVPLNSFFPRLEPENLEGVQSLAKLAPTQTNLLEFTRPRPSPRFPKSSRAQNIFMDGSLQEKAMGSRASELVR